MSASGALPVYLYKVLFEYLPQDGNPGQMVILQNDMIEVCTIPAGCHMPEEPGMTWLDGRNCRSQEVGMFPANYVRFMEKTRKHQLKITFFEKPELCSVCAEYIWGTNGEGKICQVCNSTCHLSCDGACSSLVYCKGSAPVDRNNNVPQRNTSLHLDKWTVLNVCEWMASLNLYRYVDLFKRHNIDGRTLQELNVEKLKSMGLHDEFHRSVVMVSVSELCGHNLENISAHSGFSLPPLPTREPLTSVPADHSLADYTFASLQRCLVCYKLLQGLVRQGLQCSVCGMSVHRFCSFGKLPACGTAMLNNRKRPSFSSDPKFGKELKEQFSLTGKQTAPEILVRCTSELEKRAMDTQVDLLDAYRQSPSSDAVNKLKTLFNTEKASTVDLGQFDLVTIGGVVKKYLRELADPVIPLSMYNSFIAAHESNTDLSSLVNELPPHHHSTLIFLMGHFCRLCNHRTEGAGATGGAVAQQQQHRGSPIKIIQVFCHILLRPAWENILDIVKNTEIHIKILQRLLQLDLWSEKLPSLSPTPEPTPLPTPRPNKSSDMRLEQAPWYWPQLQREEVTELLADCADGTFLVRNGKTPNDYTLTLRHNGSNKHIKIFHKDGKYGFAEPYTFPSVVVLVNYYRAHSLSEYNQMLNTMLKFPYTEEDPADIPDKLEVNLLKLREINSLYLSKQIKYDQVLSDQAKVSQELNLRLQALEAYRETITVFEEQIKLQSEYQKKCTPVEFPRLQENYELLEQRLQSIRLSREALEENFRRQETSDRLLLGEIHSLKPQIKQLSKKRENLIRNLMSQHVSKAEIDRMLHQHEMQHDSTMDEKDPEEIYMRPTESQEQIIPHYDESTWLIQCNRHEAEMMVADKADGTFLIRPRGVEHSYALTIVHGSGRINHCIISKMKTGYGFAEPFYIHETLKNLVLHYRSVSLGEHNDDLDVCLKFPAKARRRV